MAQVVALAQLRGWRSYHTFDSRRSAAGFPDVVLVRGRRLLIRELKTERGRVTDAQFEWLVELQNAGVNVGVWRPSMWAEIQAELE